MIYSLERRCRRECWDIFVLNLIVSAKLYRILSEFKGISEVISVVLFLITKNLAILLTWIAKPAWLRIVSKVNTLQWIISTRNIEYLLCRVYKSLQSSRMYSSQQNKLKSFLYIYFRRWVVFHLMYRLHSTINTLIMQYFTYNWYKTLTIHVRNLVTVEFLLFI